MMKLIHHRLQLTNHSTHPFCSNWLLYHKISSKWEGMEWMGRAFVNIVENLLYP